MEGRREKVLPNLLKVANANVVIESKCEVDKFYVSFLENLNFLSDMQIFIIGLRIAVEFIHFRAVLTTEFQS